ncbi:MAG: methylmalonate-semialdehyde dehydrogenase (CoA acylating) [Proteobacteria bacterium]|nr:MAG: methylmalonate-semialdehyde dehydrogenase (CoA acylating) [Pseudomonadota bacterium]
MTHATGPKFEANGYDFSAYVDCRNWIGGAWVPAASGATLEVLNPRHDKAMGTVAMSARADLARAVEIAKAAFPAWRAKPMRERAQVMFRLKAIMEDNVEELSWLLSHENGKVFGDAKASVLKAIECIETGSAMPHTAAGGQLDVSRGVNCRVTHEPLGVCAGIAPFNFPMMVPMWMIPQVLVGGNCFIFKPSEKVPYGAMRIAHMLKAAGLPDGVFQIVNGGRDIVEAIVEHPVIKAIGFVGSTKVARIVYAGGAAQGKRVLALGGAKNHLLLVGDADFELATENIAASAFGTTGQRCMAASVLLAVGDVQRYVDKIAEHAAAMKLGEDLGPAIDKAACDRMRRYVDEAEQLGAKVLVDGRDATGPGGGHWFGPTVLDLVTLDMPAGREEIFGPVLSIMRCDTIDDAIAIENANPYGNAAAVFTSSGRLARYCVDHLEAGMVGVNIGVPVPREPFSFGGWNESKFGHGDITGFDGVRFWTRPRKVTTKWSKQVDQTWMG